MIYIRFCRLWFTLKHIMGWLKILFRHIWCKTPNSIVAVARYETIRGFPVNAVHFKFSFIERLDEISLLFMKYMSTFSSHIIIKLKFNVEFLNCIYEHGIFEASCAFKRTFRKCHISANHWLSTITCNGAFVR